MRILAVANHLGARGGLERTQLTNCRALASRGHRVDLVYVSAGDFADDWRRFCGTMVQVRGTLPRRRHPVSSALGLLAAVSAGRRLRPDAVYVYRYWDLPYAVALRALTGAGVVLHLCLPPPDPVPRWLGPFLRRIDRVVSVSHDTVTRWEGTALPVARTSVALTGIDLNAYAPAPGPARRETRRALGVPPGAFLVLYAGRIGREKGVDVLVRAFAAVVDAVPEAVLLVVGSASLGADPADSERYRAELVAAAGDRPVSFLPARRDVADLVQAADVAVVPSLWPEPLSRSVMEPLACGVPVVATRVGGSPELLTGSLAELLVEPNDPEDLAAHVASLRHWRSERPELGERCRHHAESTLSLDREVDAVEAALAESAGSAPPPSAVTPSGQRPRRRRSPTSPRDARS